MPYRKKYCSHSCTCIYENCKLQHYINVIELRKTANDFYKNHFNPLEHTEIIDDTTKHRSCKLGLFCLDETCKKKHNCNLIFRKEMFDIWINFKKNIQVIMEENQ